VTTQAIEDRHVRHGKARVGVFEYLATTATTSVAPTASNALVLCPRLAIWRVFRGLLGVGRFLFSLLLGLLFGLLFSLLFSAVRILF
jgi:hypothetical protein